MSDWTSAREEPTVTAGPWNYACDSYGKVQHSRKACVYATKRNAKGETTQIINIAQKIANWKDAKAIAAVPAMIELLKLIDQKSESFDITTRQGREAAAEALSRLGDCARLVLELIDSNSAHRNSEYAAQLSRLHAATEQGDL